MPDLTEAEEWKAIGNRLRISRGYLGFTQEQVAQHMGLPRPSVTLIEDGTRKVTILELRKFARLYGRPPGYFTGDVPETLALCPELARKAEGLDAADKEEVARFVEFLKWRKLSREQL